MPQDLAVPADDEMHLDGCLCGGGLAPGEAAEDAELPPASGGVAPSAEAGEEVDGDMIDLAVAPEEVTPDEELPAAAGGVA